MRIVRIILYVVLGALILYIRSMPGSSAAHSTSPASPAPAAPSSETATADSGSGIPDKVTKVLATVRSTGQPPDGYVGGRVFENRESRLPAGGDYREFDVDPHQGNRNAERIIVEWNTKKAWYTSDHYQTFTPLP